MTIMTRRIFLGLCIFTLLPIAVSAVAAQEGEIAPHTPKWGGTPYQLSPCATLSANGDRLAVYQQDVGVLVYDTVTGERLCTLLQEGGLWPDLQMSASGDRLVLLRRELFRSYDTSTGELLQETELLRTPVDLVELRMLPLMTDEEVHDYVSETKHRVLFLSSRQHTDLVEPGFALSPDGETVWIPQTSIRSKHLCVLRVDLTLETTSGVPFFFTPPSYEEETFNTKGAVLNADGSQLLVPMGWSGFSLFSTEDERCLRVGYPRLSQGSRTRLALSPDGSYFVASKVEVMSDRPDTHPSLGSRLELYRIQNNGSLAWTQRMPDEAGVSSLAHRGAFDVLVGTTAGGVFAYGASSGELRDPEEVYYKLPKGPESTALTLLACSEDLQTLTAVFLSEFNESIEIVRWKLTGEVGPISRMVVGDEEE